MGVIVGRTSLAPQGPLVLPGKYEVRLKVGGQVLRQALEVKMDPRVPAARNELESSLELQLKISALLGKNFDGYQQAKQLRSRLAELMKRPQEHPLPLPPRPLDPQTPPL